MLVIGLALALVITPAIALAAHQSIGRGKRASLPIGQPRKSHADQ
jgi:hypothetical protein